MKRIIGTLLVLFAATPLLATNGYFVHGNSTASKGMAGSGIALAQESLDVAGNPAAAALLDAEFAAGFGLFSPDRGYTVTGNPSGQPGTFGLQPGNVQSQSRYFPMPSLSANFRPSQKNAFAFAFYGQGGMNTDYRTNTFYGGDHTGVDLQQMFLTATWARRLSEKQSFGISAIGAYQRFSAQGLQAFTAFSSDPDCLTNRKHANSTGFGVRIGYLAQLNRSLSFGASFSPRITMSRLNAYCGLFANDGRFDIPENATIGLAWSPVTAWTFATDVQRVHYAGVSSVSNPLFPNLATAQLGTAGGAGFGWRDMTTYKVGVRWQTSPTLALRAGYSYGKQPIAPTEVLLNILAPGVVEQHFTLGLTHELPNAPGRLNLAVMYAPSHSVTGPNPLEVPGQQSIRLSMHEWQTDVSYAFKF
jgi:long-chain fatty acid transport protein